MRFFGFLLISLSVLHASCSNECNSLGSHEVNEEDWVYADSLDYNFEVKDTTAIYDLVLELKHSPEFAFQNLYVQTTTHFPSGEIVKSPMSIDLGDLAGRWNGDCGSKSCKAPVMLRDDFRFREMGNYRIVFEQFSRNESIAGIQSMELFLCMVQENQDTQK